MKLTSVKHKNILLRVAHGEIYTKMKLQRFNLIDDNSCPRCGEAETLTHKFIECDYIARIWNCVKTLSNLSMPNNQPQQPWHKNILGTLTDSSLTTLTINAEVLLRISYFKDDQNFLIHPKVFVTNCLKYIAKSEKRAEIREEIKTLLDS